MPRNWTGALGCLVLLAIAAPASSAEAARASETLLPATTKGFVSITNTKQLVDQWNKTQLGQLIKDPVMEPFATDLRRQFEDRWSRLQRKLGLTLDDLKGVPSGEVSVALARPAENQVAVVILVDVTGNEPEAEAFLEKVSNNLTERGAKRSETTISGTTVVVFDLPPPKEEELIGPADDARPRRAVYFLKDGLLGASDDLDVIEGILARLTGDRDDALAGVPAFRAVIDRCQKDAGELAPQIRWFIEPFGYVRAVQAAVPERDRPKGRLLASLENAGFSAIQAAGGFVDFAVDRYELLYRTSIYAPKPYEKSMNMLDFPNIELSAPPSWVPRDLAAYTTVCCNILKAFDNFGPLFDEVVGEGEDEALWEDVLDTLKNDPNGPQIDLREEMFKQLGSQVIVITDYEKPISTTSERLLFAVEAKDSEAVAKAIEKNLKDEEEVRRREFEEYVIWETVPKELPAVQPIRLEVPPLGLGEEEEELIEEDEEGIPLLPNAAVTVGHGYLLVASHYEFLVKILQPIEDERETLGRAIDYLFVDATISETAGAKHCVRAFSRTDEAYRPTYELIRQGKMPESQTMLGRVLNTILAPGKDETFRKQEIDGSKLPDFEVVRRHLGPAGLFGVSEDDGWFFKGFTLKKETE